MKVKGHNWLHFQVRQQQKQQVSPDWVINSKMMTSVNNMTSVWFISSCFLAPKWNWKCCKLTVSLPVGPPAHNMSVPVEEDHDAATETAAAGESWRSEELKNMTSVNNFTFVSLIYLFFHYQVEVKEFWTSLPVWPPVHKMSVLEEEEEGGAAASSELSCVSLKSGHSRKEPPDLSNEPGPSETQWENF